MDSDNEWAPKIVRRRPQWRSAGGSAPTPGVCQLVNKVSGKVMVAGTLDVGKYGSRLMSRLRKGQHSNKHLQADFDVWGEDSFDVQVLQGCAAKLLPERLAHWVKELDACNPERGYNRSRKWWDRAPPEVRAARQAQREADWRARQERVELRAARAARREARTERRAARRQDLGLDSLPVRMSDRAAFEVSKRGKPKPVQVIPTAPPDPEAAAREWAKQQGLDWERLVTG